MPHVRSLAAVACAALLTLCARTLAAAPLGVDGDADGVPDDRDACLYSPRGVVVGPNGCSTPGDEDEDQVADANDTCPQSPPGARVDAQGCALDEDLDGVADGIDRCAGSSAGARVDARGCAARQVASPPPPRRAPAPVAITAAPAPAATVTAPAAPIAAPVLPVVAPSPAAPLPAPASQPVAVSTKGAEPDRMYFFDPGKADLGWTRSRAVKQSARELMDEIEQNPALVLVVSGHGDIKFDGMAVARVATARAKAVFDTLVAAGVPAQRVNMRVPGINEPRFYGAEQQRNCRVELRVTGRVPAPVPEATPAPASTLAVVTPPPAPRVFPDPPPRVPPNRSPRPAAPPPPPPSPLLPGSSAPVQAAPAVPRSLSTASVSFEPFSAVLDADAIQALNAFVQTATRVMLADTAARVMVVSGIGTGEAGITAQRLAESRAGSVSAYLAAMGLPHTRMEFSHQAQTGERRVEVSVIGR